MTDRADIAIIGAGAAGLMAAICAGRALRASGSPATVVALDGARTIGAKILVAGGGRCNVTHHEVDESAYAGSSRHSIKKVLRSFDVPRTVEFFRDLGVELKREETGKLFPTTDDAHTVLDALLAAARNAGVQLLHPWRVKSVERAGDSFVIESESLPAARIHARRLILATGGKALPKTGSDGAAYDIARSLGHTISERVFPALVPLLLDPHHPTGAAIRSLSGLTFPATLDLRAYNDKKLISFTDSTLCTHFGLSGPGVLDISRHFAAEKGARLFMSVLPGTTPSELDALLTNPFTHSPRGISLLRWLIDFAPHPAPVVGHGVTGLPERLARALCNLVLPAPIDPAMPAGALTREQRLGLVKVLTALFLPITGDRGFTFAEATAGGVPLSELKLDTMESRTCPGGGLFICGELCDVDGRIGGFNFQWAWSSGHLAGIGAARSL